LAQQAGEVIEYNPCGKLYLITDEKRQERYNAMIENWGWGEDYARLVDAQEASDIAGIEVAYDALYLPHSGSINPRKLCAYYAQDIEVHLNYSVTDLSELDADAVILCCGSAVSEFEELSWLELRKTRGQLSTVEATQNSSALRCHVNYGGYISAMHHNQHVVGATFEKEVAHTQVTQESHAMNMSDLQVNLLKQEDFKITDGRAAHRVATSDHFPVIGAVPNSHNIYVSAALGSYGVVSSLMGAKVITDMIRGGPQSLPHDVLYALSPRRFVDRAAKKGRVL
jgi:tRNA 5-methylaminomethyl-2-thiouridine biosynthesis bifunctional protein